jgi:hypothetical protein
MEFILESQNNSWVSAAREQVKCTFMTRDDKLHTFKPPCDFIFITWTNTILYSVNDSSLKLQQKCKHTELNLKSKKFLSKV